VRHARGFWLAVAVMLAAGTVTGGDPDVAGLLFKKARKAFSSKDYAEAESGFRRALKELTPYPDARFGLAESLEKLDRPREAYEEYRGCVAEIDAAGAPSKWKSLRSRAQQAMSRLQERHAELAKLNDAFIRKCIDFGKKHAKSDPQWARKAFETVLLLDPGNEVAQGLLDKLPAPDPSGDAKPEAKRKGGGKPETLFRRDLWSGGSEWSVDSDRITGDVRRRDGTALWLDGLPLEGRYTVRGRYKLKYDGGERRAYGIFFAGDRDAGDWWAVVATDKETIVLERWEARRPTLLAECILSDFDHTMLHNLEIAVEPGKVTVRLDGTEIIKHEDATASRAGTICLFVQNACIEWRDLEAER
jgi:tetratricopeptide (TPR) repeat protein